jgi:xylan 1,4-beta-xylosidase
LNSIGLVDSLSYWTFTDVFEKNRNTDFIFHGGFGLINYQEIAKPAFHAYRFMNELGDEILMQTTGGIVSRESKTGRISAVAYNYPPETNVSLPVTHTQEAADAIDDSGRARDVILSLNHLPANASFLWRPWTKSMEMPLPHGKPWASRSRPTGNRPQCFVIWHGTQKSKLFDQTLRETCI